MYSASGICKKSPLCQLTNKTITSKFKFKNIQEMYVIKFSHFGHAVYDPYCQIKIIKNNDRSELVKLKEAKE